MKQPAIQLQIPNPCHENWSQMTPVEQGRFCNACATTVVDFSIMTDQQILNYLSSASGGICGRLQESQLHRTLQPMPVPPKTQWWMALLMPLLLGAQRLKAQRNGVIEGKVAYKALAMQVKNAELASQQPAKKIPVHISGTVTDTAGKPVPYAIIHLESPVVSVTADENGRYSLHAEAATKSVVITATSLGYSSQSQTVLTQPEVVWNYVLAEEVAELNPVMIQSYGTQKGRVVTGGAVAIVRCANLKDTVLNYVKDTLGKLVAGKPEHFAVFPNPVRRNQQFILHSRETDNYTVQVVNNSGGVVYVQYFKSAKDVKQYITAQSFWLPGVYYVRIEDEKTKKQYSQKIIVL